MTAAADPTQRLGRAGGNDGTDQAVRLVAWANLFLLGMFLTQTVAVILGGFPAPSAALSGEGGLGSWLMLLLYPATALAAVIFVLRTPLVGLREDCDRISAFNVVLVRGAFFAVLYVGLVDAALSFMRIENLLAGIVGQDLSDSLGRSLFRGPWVHLPLVALGFVTGIFVRGTLGFTWLALLIVVAELLIVISRFVYSYEQSFMGDLVRFWYAALFLFASAYTFLDEGHVRVDVFYAGMRPTAKGAVNATGCLLLGMTLCWVILVLGMSASTSAILAPMLKFEIPQATTGMYVKWMMAGYLAFFAITMLIQFCANLMDAVADWRGQPGHRDHDPVAPA
jgi:TRAP-type mannitol/chloroaromatic compound transport system permease small subunit